MAKKNVKDSEFETRAIVLGIRLHLRELLSTAAPKGFLLVSTGLLAIKRKIQPNPNDQNHKEPHGHPRIFTESIDATNYWRLAPAFPSRLAAAIVQFIGLESRQRAEYFGVPASSARSRKKEESEIRIGGDGDEEELQAYFCDLARISRLI